MTKIIKQNQYIYTAIILFTFLLINISTVHAEEDVLDQVVKIETVGEYDEKAAAEMKERIGTIHPLFLEVLAEKEVVIKLINFPLTDLPEYAYLKGEVPRGWEGTGLTWEDVPGAGGDPTVARIGKSDPNDPDSGHDDINLELHEIGHAVDEFVFDDISFSDEFVSIHEREKDGFLPDVYFDFVEEYFAEAFAYYYLNEESRQVLLEKAPETKAFIDSLPQRVEPLDTTPPVLVLEGDDSVNLKVGEDYEELGATAMDEVDGDLSEEVQIVGEVNTDQPGEYAVEYSVIDEAGNEARKTRTVRVVKRSLAEVLKQQDKPVDDNHLKANKTKYKQVGMKYTPYIIISFILLVGIIVLTLRRRK